MDADRVLRSSGLRVTTARRLVLEALGESEGHLDAEAIAELVRAADPGLHLSTIYRTLDALEETGVIRHVHFGHGSATYHLAERDHAHAVCEGCGRVIELDGAELGRLASLLDRTYGFRLDTQHFALVGRCASCR